MNASSEITHLRLTDSSDHPALSLELEKQGDRFVHRVTSPGHAGDSMPITWLTSREGDPGAPWPPSPPLQQIHFQTIADRDVIMAVGMAGQGHWSASFSVESQPYPGILCEMAVRGERTEDSFAGSHYRVAEGVSVVPALNGGWQLIHPSRELALVLHPMRSACNWLAKCQELCLEPESRPESGLKTVQWSYFFYWQPISV